MPSRRLAALAMVALLGISPGCDHAAEQVEPDAAVAERDAATETPHVGEAVDAGTDAGADERPAACRARTLEVRGPADAKSSVELADCRFTRTGVERVAQRCGRDEALRARLDLDRLDAAAPALDAATATHVRSVVARGRAIGRNARSFGLAGDSLTLPSLFLGPFAAGAKPGFSLAPDVAARLRVAGGPRLVMEHYRGEPVVRQGKVPVDAFAAPRAAKIGARASWVLSDDGRGHSPLTAMIERVSPAVAVVMFGSNDAAYRMTEPEGVARGFAADLRHVVDALEASGVVVVLTTPPRHGRAPSLPDCARDPAEPSNWRLAVQTNAVAAAVAELACERALPLVDLRAALEELPNHGLGKDGVHLTSFADGAGVLDEAGLSCGFNVRNYVTLKMLTHLVPLLDEDRPADTSTAP